MTTWLILSEIPGKPNVGALQLSSYVRHNFQLTTILMPRKLAIVNIWCLLELPSLFSTYWPLVILISERYFYPMITRFISPLFCLCCYIVFLRNHDGLNWFLREYSYFHATAFTRDKDVRKIPTKTARKWKKKYMLKV